MNKLEKISEHVYILPFNPKTDRPVIGYIKGQDESLLFDLGTGPKTLRYLKKGLKVHNLPYPNYLVLSHYHWDHSFASGYLKGPLYASKYTYDKMQEIINMNIQNIDDLISDDLMPAFCKEHLHMEYKDVKDIKLRLPNYLIEEINIFDLGGVHVVIFPTISRHCDGNLLCLVEEDKLLFTADADSGYIKGFEFYDDPIKYQKFLETIKPLDFDKVIYGHLKVVTKEEFFNNINTNKEDV